MLTQGNRHLDRSQGGLGIGLSIVKRLVEMHGGTVEARSDGEGLRSEFIVPVPLSVSSTQRTLQAAGERDALVALTGWGQEEDRRNRT